MYFSEAARLLPKIKEVLNECEGRYLTITDCVPLVEAVDLLYKTLSADYCPWGYDKELCAGNCKRCTPPEGTSPWKGAT